MVSPRDTCFRLSQWRQANGNSPGQADWTMGCYLRTPPALVRIERSFGKSNSATYPYNEKTQPCEERDESPLGTGKSESGMGGMKAGEDAGSLPAVLQGGSRPLA